MWIYCLPCYCGWDSLLEHTFLFLWKRWSQDKREGKEEVKQKQGVNLKRITHTTHTMNDTAFVIWSKCEERKERQDLSCNAWLQTRVFSLHMSKNQGSSHQFSWHITNGYSRGSARNKIVISAKVSPVGSKLVNFEKAKKQNSCSIYMSCFLLKRHFWPRLLTAEPLSSRLPCHFCGWKNSLRELEGAWSPWATLFKRKQLISLW